MLLQKNKPQSGTNTQVIENIRKDIVDVLHTKGVGVLEFSMDLNGDKVNISIMLKEEQYN